MADAPAAANKDAAPAKKLPVVVIALVAVNLTALSAGGAYLFLSSNSAEASTHHSDDDEDEEGDEDEGDDEEDDGEEHGHELGPLVEFESLVVNLANTGGEHYLKITFQLELRNEEALEHVESRMVPFRDRVLSYFGAQSVEDVAGSERTVVVREEILGIAREVFGRRMIRAIYFTELLVQ